MWLDFFEITDCLGGIFVLSKGCSVPLQGSQAEALCFNHWVTLTFCFCPASTMQLSVALLINYLGPDFPDSHHFQVSNWQRLWGENTVRCQDWRLCLCFPVWSHCFKSCLIPCVPQALGLWRQSLCFLWPEVQSRGQCWCPSGGLSPSTVVTL